MFFIGTREKIESSSILMHLLPAGAVLVTMLGLSFLSWRNTMEAFRNERDALTSNFVQEVRSEIDKQQEAHSLILTSASGLFNTSDEITRQDWQTYIRKFDLENNFPEFLGIGYAKYANNTNDLAMIAASAKNAGIPDININKEGTRSEFLISFYFEPNNNYPSGIDLMADKQRRNDIKQAIESRKTSITSKREYLTVGSQKRIGYSMYIPVFSDASGQENNDNSLSGFVYARILSKTFFDRTIGTEPNQKFAIRVYDESESSENLLYESAKFASITSNDHYSQKSFVEIYGKNWILDFRFDPAIISETTRSRPLNSIVAGILLSILLSGFVLTLLSARTRALSHNQEMEVQSAKDELLSLASHQLRTPATSVKQYIGMLLEGFAGKLPANQKELLEKAYESNERQLHIINELLYVAKIDSKGIVLTPRRLNLQKLVREVVQDFLPEARKNNQKILVDLPERNIYVEADEHCLRMSLENLINNALKYSQAGRPVTVKLSSKGNEVQISVRDRGIGISEDDKPLLFKQFSRIPNEYSLNASGSGIGLYLSQQLINLHGGEITVDSKPGTGATFTIHLPKTQKFENQKVSHA